MDYIKLDKAPVWVLQYPTCSACTVDLDMIPSALALCATHGHPEHAEYLRQVMLVGAALAGGE